jgi:chromate transport protein ChrA
VEPREFLLGFGILQALPGPVFNLAGLYLLLLRRVQNSRFIQVYLGALALPHNPALGGIIGYVGLYLPGILLKLSLLPLYSRFRSHRAVRSVLSGLTAGGVGLIWGALYKLWSVGFVVNGAAGDTKSLDESGWWLVVAAGSFLGCEWLGAWPPFAIAGGALAGISWWGVTKD